LCESIREGRIRKYSFLSIYLWKSMSAFLEIDIDIRVCLPFPFKPIIHQIIIPNFLHSFFFMLLYSYHGLLKLLNRLPILPRGHQLIVFIKGRWKINVTIFNWLSFHMSAFVHCLLFDCMSVVGDEERMHICIYAFEITSFILLPIFRIIHCAISTWRHCTIFIS